MSAVFSFTSASVAVTSHERKSARLESTYDALAAHLSLTPDTESADMTDAARAIVLEGAHNDGTVLGATLDESALTGRDPGTDVATRPYWKAARAVRIGLVSAIKRANPATDDDDDDSAPVMRVSLKGVGNGVVPEDHPAYAMVLALLSGE